MTTVSASSQNPDIQFGSDLAVLQRKWQAAVLPGQGLPGYEEVMLGSLGRLADHIALLKVDGDDLELSRTGRYVQSWVGHDRWNVPLSDVPPDCALALAQVARNALQNQRPHLAVASCVRDGLVQKYDLLALPTASRWGGTLIGVYVNEQGRRYHLLDSIFTTTDDGILSLAAIRDHQQRSSDFHIVHLNPSAARLLGQPAQALLWSRLRAGSHLLSSAAVIEWLRQVIDGHSNSKLEIDSDQRSLSLSATACGDMLSVTMSDVTSLKRREASFRLLFDNNPMPMWVIDAGTLAFLKVNDAAIAHYGYSREAFLGMRVPEIWPPDEREAHLQAVLQASDNYLTDRNWRHLKADGTEIEIVAFGRRVAFEGHDGYLVAVVDVTERRKAEARIAYMAHHDALTGLPNREAYQQRMQSLLELRGDSYVAVLCVDLDLFKNVNDAFGHPIGDRLLQMVAERLRQQTSGRNLAVRLGGDEFVIVLAQIASPNEASDVATALIERLSVPYTIDGLDVVIGASIGIALSPSDGGTADELLRNADMALDRAKDSGGNCHHFFEPEMDRLAQRRRDLEIDLRRAFACGQFELHYQPLIGLAEGRIAGFEALLRWRHPERGMISPAEFVPVAEDIGLIVGIGEWVLRQACAEAASWPEHIKVAVNLSPVQFRSRHLVQAVISALAQSGLPASRLELEITETVFLAETEANLATLHQLRDLGVRISMDDFGTGYSSLSYLRSFPFDKIKIDRSFVQDLAHRPDCLAIVRAISGLGRSLNITTTAEGVESAEQLDWLRAEGCNEGQGFLFSPARPGAEVAALLAQFGGQRPRAVEIEQEAEQKAEQHYSSPPLACEGRKNVA